MLWQKSHAKKKKGKNDLLYKNNNFVYPQYYKLLRWPPTSVHALRPLLPTMEVWKSSVPIIFYLIVVLLFIKTKNSAVGGKKQSKSEGRKD